MAPHWRILVLRNRRLHLVALLLVLIALIVFVNVPQIKLRVVDVPSAARISNVSVVAAGALCGCVGVYLDEREKKELELRALGTGLVALRKPKSRFHSNHWFHNGEYFLSMHSSQALASVVSHGDSLVVLANEVKFVRKLTAASAFLLFLALSPDGSAKRLEVHEPTYLSVRVDAAGRKWGSFSSYGPGFVYDRHQQFFSTPAFGERTLGHSSKTCYCGKLVDFVGRSPTKSSQWFKSNFEAQAMRSKIEGICTRQSVVIAKNSSAIHTLIVYQRNDNRKFRDIDGLLEALRRQLQKEQQQNQHWQVKAVTHSEDLQPCELYALFADCDLLLSTHGFQNTALMFLRPGAALVEIFPFKYWKNSYVDLAAKFGVVHAWAQNQAPTSMSRFILHLVPQAWCMSSNRCRTLARGDDVLMPPDHLQLVIKTAKSVELNKISQ